MTTQYMKPSIEYMWIILLRQSPADSYSQGIHGHIMYHNRPMDMNMDMDEKPPDDDDVWDNLV